MTQIPSNPIPQKPFFTIITSTLNVEACIERLIKSVVSQTFTSVEHLFIDGGSTDQTIQIINKFSPCYNCTLLASEPDEGIYHAWNKALPHVKGQWVLFIGADDYLINPNALEESFQYLKHLDVNQYMFGCSYVLNANSNSLLKTFLDYQKLINNSPLTKSEIRRGDIRLWPHPGVFHNSILFRQGKKFDQSYKIAADAKFVKEHKLAESSSLIPVITTVHTLEGISNSQKTSFIRFKERARVLSEIGSPWPFWPALYHGIRAYLVGKGLSRSALLKIRFVRKVKQIVRR